MSGNMNQVRGLRTLAKATFIILALLKLWDIIEIIMFGFKYATINTAMMIIELVLLVAVVFVLIAQFAYVFLNRGDKPKAKIVLAVTVIAYLGFAVFAHVNSFLAFKDGGLSFTAIIDSFFMPIALSAVTIVTLILYYFAVEQLGKINK